MPHPDLFCSALMSIWIPLVCGIYPKAWHTVGAHLAQILVCGKCSTSIGLAHIGHSLVTY